MYSMQTLFSLTINESPDLKQTARTLGSRKLMVPARHQFRSRDARLAVCFFQGFVYLTNSLCSFRMKDNNFSTFTVILNMLWHILLMVTLVMALSLRETQLYNINHSRYTFSVRLGTEFKYLLKRGRPDPGTERGRGL